MEHKNEEKDRMNYRVALGRCGEEFAAQTLRLDGYIILEKNFRCRFGEIDIIAEKDGRLLFTEVKTRRTANFGRPVEAVDRRKIQHIRKAAFYWLRENREKNYMSFSFQVIEVMVNRVENAF